MVHRHKWLTNLPEEIKFWDSWFKTKGLQWKEDYNNRINKDLLLQEHIALYLPKSDIVKILDVGAGPLTILGKKHKNKKLAIFACDPLAREYDRIMAKYNIVPQIRTILEEAEKLTNTFNSNLFDIVHCQNALDHSYEPISGIMEMIKVCKQDGVVILIHENNEAENEKYQGLHQWNFCKRNGEFVIWNKTQEFNVNKCLINLAEVSIMADEVYNTVIIKKI